MRLRCYANIVKHIVIQVDKTMKISLKSFRCTKNMAVRDMGGLHIMYVDW